MLVCVWRGGFVGETPLLHLAESIWRGGEVVTRESAKLLCEGPIPFRASDNYMSSEQGVSHESHQDKNILSRVLGSVVDVSRGVFQAILGYFVDTKKK